MLIAIRSELDLQVAIMLDFNSPEKCPDLGFSDFCVPIS